MKLDSLSELEDDGLRAIIGRAEELLAQHDKERKAKALEEARATLAAVGLTLKDLSRSKGKPAKGGCL
jgi:Asp-tRNA(Asn)/Glu-tRNA(Gln) amidotransferase A subunit family amidase